MVRCTFLLKTRVLWCVFASWRKHGLFVSLNRAGSRLNFNGLILRKSAGLWTRFNAVLAVLGCWTYQCVMTDACRCVRATLKIAEPYGEIEFS